MPLLKNFQCLNLTDHLGVDCSAKIPMSFLSDRTAWQKASHGVSEQKSTCSFNILMLQTLWMYRLTWQKIAFRSDGNRVPDERSTLGGKINWVMRQLRNPEAPNSFVKVRWKSRAADEFVEMAKFDANFFQGRQLNTTILSLTPIMQLHSSRLFGSRKNFITELEALVLNFYDEHAQHLKQWQPSAPKPLPESDE